MEDILYCCKIVDKSDNPQIALELLLAKDYEVSTWDDKEFENNTYHIAYFADSESASYARDEILADKKIWFELGIKFEISLMEIKKEDWNEVWKRFFKIEHITERLVIKPSWLEYEKKDNELIIHIDPGMSFGTGNHPTTKFCLKTIDELSDKKEIKSFLDAGCGSGILSIAASLLDYKIIEGFDIDEDAVEIANENLERNGIKLNENCNMVTSDLANIHTNKQYDLVNGNILSHILLQNKEKLASLVKKNGYLILAGILSKEYNSFKQEFIDLGFKEIKNYIDKEWKSGLFIKNGNAELCSA